MVSELSPDLFYFAEIKFFTSVIEKPSLVGQELRETESL